MSVQLQRKAPKLLSFVNGKPHATAEHHEEQLQYRCERERIDSAMHSHWESDQEIDADPISSGDETVEPMKQRSPTPPTPVIAKIEKTVRSRTLEFPQSSAKRKSTRKVTPRVPRSGVFAHNQEAKEKRKAQDDGEEGKENSRWGSSAQPENPKRSAEIEDDGPQWGMGHARNKKPKTTYANMHAPPPGQIGSGTNKSLGSGTPKGSAVSSKVPPVKKTIRYSKKAQVRELDSTDDKNDDLSDISMAELDTSLLNAKKKKKKKKKRKAAYDDDDEEDKLLALDGETIAQSPPAKLPKPSLLEQLADYRRDQTPSTSQPAGSGNTFNPNLDPNVSDTSSPLSSPSSAHNADAIKDVENYMGDLQEETSEATDKCPLCEEPVEKAHYFDFWIGKKKTVFYQTMFCKDHKRRKANKEYKDKGYPEIDWDDFPSKIRDYHPQLKAVLRNEKPSEYRDKHAQRLADKDARAVRKQLDSDAAYESTTGYFGSRGKRAMMEAIASQLGPVIKECVERDPVVAFNGFATFIQSVLVPELTVWMTMDDKGVSEKKAKELVQESGALGEVVNEEVEDTVTVLESEDEIELEELESFLDDE